MAMSVRIRPYRTGGWEVDVTVRLPNGSRHRERSKAPVTSKSAAQRWGEDRERHLLQHGPRQAKKEVPTATTLMRPAPVRAADAAVSGGPSSGSTPSGTAGLL